MLDLLVEGERPVKAIAKKFEMSRPAVSQHLRILRRAGLVTEHRQGRERRYRLTPRRLNPVREWLAHYERFWDDHLLRLQQYVEKGADDAPERQKGTRDSEVPGERLAGAHRQRRPR